MPSLFALRQVLVQLRREWLDGNAGNAIKAATAPRSSGGVRVTPELGWLTRLVQGADPPVVRWGDGTRFGAVVPGDEASPPSLESFLVRPRFRPRPLANRGKLSVPTDGSWVSRNRRMKDAKEH